MLEQQKWYRHCISCKRKGLHRRSDMLVAKVTGNRDSGANGGEDPSSEKVLSLRWENVEDQGRRNGFAMQGEGHRDKKGSLAAFPNPMSVLPPFLIKKIVWELWAKGGWVMWSKPWAIAAVGKSVCLQSANRPSVWRWEWEKQELFLYFSHHYGTYTLKKGNEKFYSNLDKFWRKE